MRKFFGKFRIFKRLKIAETIINSLSVCEDCGGVYMTSHHKVSVVQGDRLEARCKWDQRDYLRSSLHKERMDKVRDQKRKVEQETATEEAKVH